MDKLALKNVEAVGIERTKAETIWNEFTEFFNGVTECSEKVRDLKVTSIDQKDQMDLARKTRLELRSHRVAASKVKKILKEDIVKEGRFIDRTYKLIEETSKPLEEKLKNEEEFAKREEEKRIAALVAKREEQLSEFDVDHRVYNLAKIPEGAFNELLLNSKLQYENRKEEERRAEEERTAREKAAEEERARMAKENERLRAEAEERERVHAEQRARAEAALAAERAKVDAERKAREEADRREREARDAALRIEQEKQREAIRKANEEREAAEHALREKTDAEERAKRDEAARIEAEQRAEEEEERRLETASDKEKLVAFLDDVMSIAPPVVNGDEAKGILSLMKNCLQMCASKIENLY